MAATTQVRLAYLHEPALLHNLRLRFDHASIYTYTGQICIAINPFDWSASSHLYTSSRMRSYHACTLDEQPPHVYAIAERAYSLATAPSGTGEAAGRSQSILVSGESGAGKTETVKIVMAVSIAVHSPCISRVTATVVRR